MTGNGLLADSAEIKNRGEMRAASLGRLRHADGVAGREFAQLGEGFNGVGRNRGDGALILGDG